MEVVISLKKVDGFAFRDSPGNKIEEEGILYEIFGVTPEKKIKGIPQKNDCFRTLYQRMFHKLLKKFIFNALSFTKMNV